jgi:hypothetical protein
MERKAHRSGRFLVRLLVLSFAGFVVAALHRERKAEIEPELDAPKRRYREAPDPTPETPAAGRRVSTPRRLAVGFALTAIFFAGAAFTAGAGNEVAGLLEETASTDTTLTSASAPDASATPPSADSAAAPAPAPAPETSTEAAPSAPADSSSSDSADDDAPATGHGSASSSEPAAPAASSDSPEGGGSGSGVAPAVTPTPVTPSPKPAAKPHRAAKRTHAHAQWVLNVPRAKKPAAKGNRHARVATAAEEAAETPGAASVIWLNRTLPDPTPPSRRLADGFAHRLVSISRANHVSWALVLGVLRAQGRSGAVPANRAELRQTAQALDAVAARGDWNAALAVTGRTSIADQAVALMHYNRAVGMSGLVDGLLAHKDDLVNRVLHDGRVTIYPGGQLDLAAGRVDVRVVVLIEYLADTYGQVTVSCLISGHRLYARPGVISAHIYGRAVDVADLGGISIYGHQEPGGITERAVRAILLLPSELQPKQVISLLGLGGPSFPLANHDDHIHVGY